MPQLRLTTKSNDAHMRNFSLLHSPQSGKPVLAPLYDVVSVEALPGEWRSMAMKMNGRTFAAAATAADIRWLAGLEPDGRTASGTAARARLDEFFRIADSVPGAITAAVHAELVSEEEAQPVRKLVSCRLDLLEKEFGWRFSAARAADTGP